MFPKYSKHDTDAVKEACPAKTVAVWFNEPVNSANKIRCPYPDHEDVNPSCHLYPGNRGFYCHSCDKGGTGFDLFMLLGGYSQPDFNPAIEDAASRTGFTLSSGNSKPVEIEAVFGSDLPVSGSKPVVALQTTPDDSWSEPPEPAQGSLLGWNDSPPPRAGDLCHPNYGEPEKNYAFEIRDREGKLATVKCRWDELSGKKISYWSNGRWGLNGLPQRDLPLYRSEKLNYYDLSRRLWIVEGEGKANDLAILGEQVVATGGAFGGQTHSEAIWLDLRELGFVDVIFWPDFDFKGVGVKHMLASQAALGQGRLVNVEELGLDRDGSDVADWLKLQSTKGDELRELLHSLPLLEPFVEEPVSEPVEYPIDLQDFMERSFPQPTSILGGVVTTHSLGMIYSWRGVGKTFFSLSMALSASLGAGLWGWKGSGKPLSTLFIDGEMSPISLQDRLQGLLRGLNKDGYATSDSRLRIIPKALVYDDNGHVMDPLDSPEGRQWVEDRIGDAKLIVLDNLSSLTAEDESDSTAWAPLQDWLIRLRTRGLSIWLVHHSGKSSEQGQRGTSRREDVLDTVIRLKPPEGYVSEDGCRFIAKFTKARHLTGPDTSDIEARIIAPEDDSDALIWSFIRVADQGAEEAVELAMEGKSTREIAKQMKKPKSNVGRWLKAAKAEGKL